MLIQPLTTSQGEIEWHTAMKRIAHEAETVGSEDPSDPEETCSAFGLNELWGCGASWPIGRSAICFDRYCAFQLARVLHKLFNLNRIFRARPRLATKVAATVTKPACAGYRIICLMFIKRSNRNTIDSEDWEGPTRAGILGCFVLTVKRSCPL